MHLSGWNVIYVSQLFIFSSCLLLQSSEFLTFSVSDTLESEDGEEGRENKGLLDLLQTGDLADVDVVVGDKTFACHKAILGAKSPFFKAAFQHNMKEKATGKITISSDIESSIVYDMLVYIYGGTIENIDDKSDKLLAAADEYCLKYLKRQCEENLCRTLTIDNCLDLLILADLHSTNILKPHVIKFVVENSREIVTQVLGIFIVHEVIDSNLIFFPRDVMLTTFLFAESKDLPFDPFHDLSLLF